MEKKKVAIKTIDGKVIFELDGDNITTATVLEQAVKRGISCREANLKNEDLRNISLNGADLSGANLEWADLKNVDLKNAKLSGSSLERANLCRADLQMAEIKNANLSFTNLCVSDISWANFSGTDFSFADFKSTFMIGACFQESILKSARFDSVVLEEVDFSDAILDYSTFYNSNFEGAIVNRASFYYSIFDNLNRGTKCLKDAKILPYIPMNLPEGEFIAWKKLDNGLIAKLKILKDSKRNRAMGDECRCNKALVMEFQSTGGVTYDCTEYLNERYSPCLYKVGEVVYADSWDNNRWDENTHGIHFFLDRKAAIHHIYL